MTQPLPPVETITLYLQMPRKKMVLFDHLMEAHEGLACVRTMDGTTGVVRLDVPAPLLAEARLVLNSIGKEIPLAFLDGLPGSYKHP